MNIEKIKTNIVVNANGCWIWMMSKSSSGYGQLKENKKHWTTHVYAYTFINGPVPPGLLIRHSCHVRECCNPSHLYLGNYKDNYHDSRNVYAKISRRRRKKWSLFGKKYSTLREAVEKTGISVGSWIKYAPEGIFQVNA